MVRAGMFVVNISDIHGRAYTIGHGTATHTATHVPLPDRATLHHTLPNATCHSKIPAEIKQTIWVFSQVPPWPPRGHRGHTSRHKYRQKVRPRRRGRVKWKAMLWAHLFALAFAYFRVGCSVESHLRCIFGAPLRLTSFMSSTGNPEPRSGPL